MMRDEDKTEAQLIAELACLRQRVAELEAIATEQQQTEETTRAQRLLLGLSYAAQAVQRARTPEAVYHAIGEHAAKLGFNATILMLSEDRAHLIVPHLPLQLNLLRAAEKLTGLLAKGQIPLVPDGHIQRIITSGETLLDTIDAAGVAEFLPRSAHPLAGQLVHLLGWRQRILAPLMMDGEVWGVLAIAGNRLTEFDIPAVIAFANQAAIAIENARLYKETQQLAAFNQSIIQNMAEGIIVQDINGVFTFINPAAAALLGYAPDELLGQHWTTVIPPDQQVIVDAANKRRIHGESDRYELEVMRQDGERLIVLIAGSPLYDAEKQLTGTMAVFTDITGRKQTEIAMQQYRDHLEELVAERTTQLMRANEQLTRSEERLTLAIVGTGGALWDEELDPDADFDAQSGVTYYSPEEHQLLEYEQGTERASPFELSPNYEAWYDYVLPEDRAVVTQRQREHFEGHTEYLDHEYRVRLKDGHIRWIHGRSRIIRDASGRPVRWIGIDWDVTERKQAAEELIKYRERLEELVGERTAELEQEIAERKRVEHALRESEGKFRSITENAVDFIFIKDKMRRYTFINPAMQALLGLPKDKILGKMPAEVFGPEQGRIIEEVDDRAYAGETVNEIKSLTINGKQFFFDTTQTPLTREDNEITSIMGIVRDVTGRIQTEEEIRSFKKALDASSDAIGMSAPDGRHYYQNQTFDEMFGEIGEDPPATLFVDETVGREIFKTIMVENEWIGEVAMYGKDRAILDILLRAYVVKENEKIITLVGMHTDITARKRAEVERAHLTHQMAQILATVPTGVLLLDAGGHIQQTNPVAEDYLTVLAGDNVGDTLQPDLSTRSNHPLRPVLTHLGDHSLVELLTSPPTRGMWHEVKADRYTFEVIARPVETGAEPEQWVMVLNDVTREREIQAQLQRQERLAAVGQLAAGVAHDFNNIMASIVLYAQMAARSDTLSPHDRERMTVITQQAWHATRLIQQILDFSRRAVLERRPFDLLPLLKEEVKFLERTLPEHIAIELTYGPDTYTVQADPTRMQQMLTNLAVNARDAMPHGGALRIELARITVAPDTAPPLVDMETGEWIRLTVADTGTGIAPEMQHHIFEPFFTTKPPGEGSGLGLAQVYGIIGQHGGHIDVETQVGEGTTFTIYLPALALPPTESPPSKTADIPQGKGEVILVVEDNAALRTALTEILELLNYRALEAANGREALAVMETQGNQIALVLSDLVMPEMGGMALFHTLREQGWQTPVILITGHPMDKELDELQIQGVSAWLLKPPDLEQLARVMADVLYPSQI
ncbi:MAG: PAS domain S-box protein [Anaerolineae bacterium]|nr:PAS domain S-box protein [Anaerolineae bacterium]